MCDPEVPDDKSRALFLLIIQYMSHYDLGCTGREYGIYGTMLSAQNKKNRRAEESEICSDNPILRRKARVLDGHDVYTSPSSNPS